MSLKPLAKFLASASAPSGTARRNHPKFPPLCFGCHMFSSFRSAGRNQRIEGIFGEVRSGAVAASVSFSKNSSNRKAPQVVVSQRKPCGKPKTRRQWFGKTMSTTNPVAMSQPGMAITWPLFMQQFRGTCVRLKETTSQHELDPMFS